MTTVTGLYPNDTWSGPRVVYTRHVCNGGAAGGDGARRPDPVHGAPARDGERAHVPPSTPGRQTTLRCRCGPAAPSSRSSPTRVPGNGDPRPLGIHFLGFNVPRRENRLRRLAAVASAERGRQLHPRLARGARRGGGRAPRDRRVRADEPGREAGDPRGARGDRRRDCGSASCRSRTAGARPGAASSGRPPSGSSAPSTCSTSPTGCIRRSAPGSARRWCTTSSRCTSRSGCRGAPSRCTARSTATWRRPAT